MNGRTVTFPFAYIGYDMIPDGSGMPFYVIQAKLPAAGAPKCAIVYKEPVAGQLVEVIRYPEVYGPPRFYVRPDGRAIVIGPAHQTVVKDLLLRDPLPGWVPTITTAAIKALVAALEAKP